MEAVKEKNNFSFANLWSNLKESEKFRSLISIFAVLFVGFIIIIPLLVNGHVNGHDSEYHFAFIRSLNEAWQEGTFFNRIFGLIGQDYGYGSGLFYSRIPAGITVIFMNILGMNVVEALALEFFLLFSLSGLVTYFFAKRIFKNRFYALITAIVYMAFPYFLTNLYVRFAFSEMFITLAFPMIIWGIYELIENKNYKIFMIFFTAGYVLAFLTHVALAIYITIFVGIYILCNLKKGIKEKLYIPFIISCLIVLLAILFFFVPMAINLGITQQNVMARTGMFLLGSAAEMFYRDMLLASTMLSLFAYIPYSVMFFMKKKTRLDKIIYSFSTASLVLVSPIFPWFLMGFAPFNMIQFAWRVFSIVSLPISFMVGFNIKWLLSSETKIIKNLFYPFLTCIIVVLATFIGVSPQMHIWQHLDNNSLNCTSHLSSQFGLGGSKSGDYYPIGATGDYVFTRGNTLIAETDLNILELANNQTQNNITLFISPNQEGFIKFNIPFEICEDLKITRHLNRWERDIFDIAVMNEENAMQIQIENNSCESQVIINYKDNSAFDKYLQEHPFEFLVKSGNATATNFIKQNVNHYKVDFNVSEETIVELPTFFYKGYTLTYTTSSGEVKNLEAIHGEHGFIEVKLTESGTLKVEFSPNYIKYSDIISILGLIIFLIACGVVLFVPRKYFSAVADWIDNFFERKRTLAEIIRFLVVGAISTIIDMLVMGFVMYLMQPSIYPSIINVFINAPDPSTLATIIGTTIGSIAGMLVSYVLSIIFVFNEKGESKSVKGFVIFALLTAIGLGINMLGTYLLYDLLSVNQWITKIIMVIIVLIYNYISKRLMLFKDKPKTTEDKILDILMSDIKKNKNSK